MTSYWLSIIVFLPVLGGLVVLALHRNPPACRVVALSVCLIDLLLVLTIALRGPAHLAGPAGAGLLAEERPWIESMGISYHLGMDGVSLMLSLLTTFLVATALLVSWKAVSERVASFHFLLLLTETGVLGVFLARDLFLFYLFWEVQIIPVFFLIGIWGHEDRLRATVKFLMYSLSGSLLMLIALIGLYVEHGARSGVYTFSLGQLLNGQLPFGVQVWLYAGFLLGLGIKVPLIPIHTWLPDAHTEAPTAGSVILAGLLLKTGTYGLLRIAFPLFPEAARGSAPLLLVLGLAGLFYAGWIAFCQKDIKRLVAYSSIAHMGLIVIGLAVWNTLTLQGSLLQMINHGVSTSALFIMVGMLTERIDSRELSSFGGLWKRMPVFGAFFLLFSMSSMGLPGLNNFVGEILILVGTYRTYPVAAVFGFAGLVLTLLFILKMVREALFGPLKEERHIWDVTPRETMILSVLAIIVILIGVYPEPVLTFFDQPVRSLVEQGIQLAARH